MQTQTFRNRSASLLWGFAAVWVGMLALMTWVLARDGAPAGHSFLFIATIFVVFWACGVGLLIFAASHPCVIVVVEGDQVRATWRYPLRVDQIHYPARNFPKARVADEKDSDGDPYFFARVVLAEGRTLELDQSHSRAVVERTCERFNEAIEAKSS